MWHNTRKSIFGVDFALYLTTFMLHDCIVYYIHMTVLCWMGVAKSRYQFISSSWGLLSIATSRYVSNNDNTSTVFENRRPENVLFKFLTTSVEQLFQPAFRWLLLTISWVKNNISKNFEKPAYAPVHSLCEIPSKENYLKKCKKGCSGGRVLQQTFRLDLC